MKLFVAILILLAPLLLSAQNEAWLDPGGINLLDEEKVVAPQHFRCVNGDTDSIAYRCIGVNYKGEAEYFLSEITDSTGKVIFRSTDIDECWDGILENGERIPPGEYNWHVKAKMVKQDAVYEHIGKIFLMCCTEEELQDMLDAKK